MKTMRFSLLAASLLMAWALVPARGLDWDEVIFRSVDISNPGDPADYVSLVIHEYRALDNHQFALPAGVDEVGLLMVGGGGAGAKGNNNGGGGGAGGLVYAEGYEDLPTGTLTVAVGDGGQGGTWRGANGQNSSLGTLTAMGGGGGGSSGADGRNGGSGGGNPYGSTNVAGTGLQPTETPGIGYGNDGHVGTAYDRGGGGGAGLEATGRAGGPGMEVWGAWYAGGGGSMIARAAGGIGGGGRGGNHVDPFQPGEDGSVNTGGGGGASDGRSDGTGGSGGSGIVIVRYALADVTSWDGGNGFYDLSGSARRVLVEDAVKVRVPDAASLTINADGELRVEAGASLTVDGTLTVSAGAVLGGGGVIYGGLTLIDGARLAFSKTEHLTVNDGHVDLGNLGVARLTGLTSEVEIGDYTLIDGTNLTFTTDDMENLGETEAFFLGDGKSAYFEEGSLVLKVIPEPGMAGLLLVGGALLALRRRRA